jgi:hypothetical protein
MKKWILLLLIQLGFFAGWYGLNQHYWNTSPTVRLELGPIDPYDPIRGRYFILNPKINQEIEKAFKQTGMEKEQWFYLIKGWSAKSLAGLHYQSMRFVRSVAIDGGTKWRWMWNDFIYLVSCNFRIRKVKRGGKLKCWFDPMEVQLRKLFFLKGNMFTQKNRDRRRVLHIEYAGCDLPEPLRWNAQGWEIKADFFMGIKEMGEGSQDKDVQERTFLTPEMEKIDKIYLNQE